MKPCPFCGSRDLARIRNGKHVRCNDCGGSARVEVWNGERDGDHCLCSHSRDLHGSSDKSCFAAVGAAVCDCTAFVDERPFIDV